MTKLIKLITINLLVFASIIGFLEVILLYFLKSNHKELLIDKKKIEKIAYEGLTEEYKLLNKKCNLPRILNFNGSAINFAKDFSCPKMSFKNGQRTTTGSNESAAQKIHVFGGSTILGQGTIDRGTIPSKLQSLISDNKITSVTNQGFGSLVLTQQFDKLKSITINKKDIIVFYDGGNDAFNTYIYNNKDGNIIGYNRGNKFLLYSSIVKSFLSKNSSIYIYLSRIKNTPQNEKLKCEFLPTYNQREIKKMTSYYLDKIKEINDYVESRQAYFYHFLQPIMDYKKEYLESDYYNVLLRMSNFQPCLMESLNSYYSILSSEYDNSNKEVNKFNLSKSLKNDEKNINFNYFIDWIHINSKGNHVISGIINSKIKDKILSK